LDYFSSEMFLNNGRSFFVCVRFKLIFQAFY